MSARLGPGIKCETAIGRSEPKVGRARLRNGYWYLQSLRWILATPLARPIRCRGATQRDAAKPAWRLVERFGGGAPRAAARPAERDPRNPSQTLSLLICRSGASPHQPSASVTLRRVQQRVHATPMRCRHGKIGKIFNLVITVIGR